MLHQLTQHHLTSREITIMFKKMNHKLFISGWAVAGLILTGLFLIPTAFAKDYTVRNDKELQSVLADTEPVKDILFIDNVFVDAGTTFTINPGDNVHIDLGAHNFQSNGAVYLTGIGNVTIKGSTTGFNGGLHIGEKIVLTYDGTYMMSGIDRFGDGSTVDDVIVNLMTPGSKWIGSTLPGPYLNNLTEADTRNGTLIIGDLGTATMNVSNGNIVRNAETILGAQTTGVGTLKLSKDADWFTSGSFYVGFEGQGTLNISDGVETRTGSIVVGKEATARGWLLIDGPGTVLNLYGREGDAGMESKGFGVLELTNGARINFDEYATRLGDRSGYAPRLGLGTGESFVDNSTVFGAIVGNTGYIIGPDGGPNSSQLTFRNNSVLEGKLNIKMDETVFNTGSIVTPGLGSYSDHEGFGRFDFKGNFIHQPTASTYIDFNVFGNKSIVPLPVYNNTLYQGDKGRDLITVDGNAELEGDIYFRPQSGYYSDRIDVEFMQVTGSIGGQYDEMHLIPDRWFSNWALDKTTEPGSNYLRMDRNRTPFTDVANSYNLRGVGSALNGIYNAQNDREWLHVLDWMWLMNDNELRNAMRQLSGETRANSFLMPVRSPWRFAFDRTDLATVNRSHREQQRSCGSFQSQAVKIANNDLWAAPFYDYFHGGFDGNSNSVTNSRVGILVGYDRAMSANSTLGFLFAYSSPEMTQWYSRVSADDYLMGVHFDTLIRDKYELKLWGSYGTQAYRLHRELAIPERDGRMTAGLTGNTVALSSQIAMPLQWRHFVIRPLAALDLSVVQQNAATERGYEAIALRYESSTWAQLFARLGVKADYSWRKWDFNTSLSYVCMFAGDEAPTVKNQFVIGGPSFKVAGTDLGRHFFDLGLGGRRWLDDQHTHMIFVQYNGEYGQHSNQQTVALGYQRAF